MNWNQFIEADRQECIKDAINKLESSMTSITEALEALDEFMSIVKSADLPSFVMDEINDVKTELNDTQDSIELMTEVLQEFSVLEKQLDG